MSNKKKKTISFKEDLFEKELIPVKVLLFLQTAGDMALYPFLTLHLKSLGMSLTEIGMQFAIAPIATLIGTPLLGMLADKIGDFKRMLGISLCVCAMLAYSLLLVPPIKTTSQCSTKNASFTLSCQSNTSFSTDITVHLPDCIEKIKPNAKFRNRNAKQNSSLIQLNECIVNCGRNVFCLNTTDQQICLSSASVDVDLLVINSNTNSIDVSIIDATINGTKYEHFNCDQNDCDISCSVLSNKIPNYSHKKFVVEESRQITFWSYLLIRIALFVVIVSEVSLLRAAILTLIGKCKSEYGYQRLWTSIAMILIPPITGLLMDFQKDENSFAICFHIYAAFKILMAIISQFMNLDVKAPSLDVWKKAKKLFVNSEVTVLLIFVTFLGSSWGFIETFIVWYLEELGASRLLIGISITVGAISGIPMSIFAGDLERRFGHIRILIFGLIVYAIRMVGYSYSTNAYYILIFESMEGITMSLILITITTYSTILSSTELVATMQATWVALHFSVGRAVGSGIGGWLMDEFGSQNAYRIYAVMCLMAAVIYSTNYLFWLKNNEKVRQQSIETYEKDTNVSKDELNVKNNSNNHFNGTDNPTFDNNDEVVSESTFNRL